MDGQNSDCVKYENSRKRERERERKKTATSYSMHAAQSKIIHLQLVHLGFCFAGTLLQRSIRSWRAFATGRGTCRHLPTESSKISTGFNNYTICYTRLFRSPSGKWRVRVFRRTPINSSASELWFVNQFCASTIKAPTSMLHLPVLVPFTNRMSICALIVA